MTTTQPSNHLRSLSSPLLLMLMLTACGSYDSGASEFLTSGFESGETGATAGIETGDDTGMSTTQESGGDGDGDGDPAGDGDGDGEGMDAACGSIDCGVDGSCVVIDGFPYCECPEETAWNLDSCGACPLVDAAGHAIELDIVTFDGQYLLQGASPPKSEYDDAKMWLENASTGDRVLLGNTHDETFAVRVTPGIYDVVYELETPGELLPHNARVRLRKIALFDSQTQNIDIPVTRVDGPILLNGQLPPADEYDDARILFRDHETGGEVLVGNTHDGSYQINLVPGDYDVLYRVETPGPITPRNDGAVLATVAVVGDAIAHPIDITSVPLSGEFLLAGAPPPASEYDDANVGLESSLAGTVLLGNTHDLGYELNVIPGDYEILYMHETGANMPQNQRARFGAVPVTDGGVTPIDIPHVMLTGELTINGEPPPASEFDDAVVHLQGVGNDDLVLVGNTHDGSYVVNVIPGTYDVYYAQETAGGTVPENKRARVLTSVPVDNDGVLDIDVEAVAISGNFTLAGELPPSSVYEDGSIYLRNTETDDAVLLGNTHNGGYSAVVVPGEYELFYVQEVGGTVPSNQNAALTGVTIGAAMTLDVNVPVVDLSGDIVLSTGPVPDNAGDGGQLYLRARDGDSVLLGNSFAAVYAAKLVAGTYGVYYRSETSLTMPENANGRFACITVE
jgi:hypothetical protein